MKGMKAVLYPIWRIDAIFEGGVESEKTRNEKDAYLAVEEGYVPGQSPELLPSGSTSELIPEQRESVRAIIISVVLSTAIARRLAALQPG